MIRSIHTLLIVGTLALLFSCSSSKHCGDRSKYILGSAKFSKSIKGTYCVDKILFDQKSKKARIRGYVIDRTSGDFLAAEIIFDDKKKLGQFANENGFFESEVEPGMYKIQVQHVGFTTLMTRQVKLVPNTITEIYFYLGMNVVR